MPVKKGIPFANAQVESSRVADKRFFNLVDALATKQNTLTSGTSIKTINGSSVLGSGNLSVSGSTAWGGITGTLASQTDLQSALDAKVTDASVRGGAVDLNSRIGVISNFASPNAGGLVVGQYYDNSFQGTASSVLAGAANRIDLAPYYTSTTFTMDRVGVAVSTAVAAALGRVVIYSSDTDGWPDTLLFESADLNLSTTGMKEDTVSMQLLSGVQYWVGVRHSSTAALRTINVSSAVNLGLTSSAASNYATVLRRALTFATPATSPWSFANSDRRANTTPPSVRMRVASVP